jgi:deoxycytidine triphosphate deaminase
MTLLSPIKAIENGWIKSTKLELNSVQDWKDNNFISPNGIDFTLEQLFEPSKLKSNVFIHRVDDTKKQKLNYHEINPFYISGKSHEGFKGWRLNSKAMYDALSGFEINLPGDVAALLIQRSTMNRNMVTAGAGAYDAGYKGPCGFWIRNNNFNECYIEQGARVGQIIFYKAQSAHSYNGQYQKK